MYHIFCPVHWWVWSISEPPKAFLPSVKSSLVRKGHSMSIWSSTWDKDLKSVLKSDRKWMNLHVITMNKLDKCASPISKICHRCHSQVIFVVTEKPCNTSQTFHKNTHLLKYSVTRFLQFLPIHLYLRHAHFLQLDYSKQIWKHNLGMPRVGWLHEEIVPKEPANVLRSLFAS